MKSILRTSYIELTYCCAFTTGWGKLSIMNSLKITSKLFFLKKRTWRIVNSSNFSEKSVKCFTGLYRILSWLCLVVKSSVFKPLCYCLNLIGQPKHATTKTLFYRKVKKNVLIKDLGFMLWLKPKLETFWKCFWIFGCLAIEFVLQW